MRKRYVIGGIMLVMVFMFLGVVSYSSKVYNPFVGVKGLIQISIGDEKVEKVSDEPLICISRTYDDFIGYIKDQGYSVDQMGRGFRIEKGDDVRTLMAEGFMGRYELFVEYVE